ncbi:hypothetical protein [Blastopirellula marina]|uniref:Lipoprotein n=1 Tax=Blastopirellula marina DSM 3645 TaxID=314230 RepID=A3ZWK9_9BACT|nr:hypothetical protein [Blastopirellula marina]EAQ78983.1 hypothetical protein DSM3645_13505 [Blastopirellula marina DSM 3645]
MPSKNLVRRWRFLLAIAACGLTFGCGKREHWMTDTYPASGVVTVNGEKAEGAIVMLFPTSSPVDLRNSKPWGVVGVDGVYQLGTYEQRDGAPSGEYDVTLVWSTGLTPDRLKGAYSNPSRAVMQVTINSETNELPPIELSGVSVLAKPTGDSSLRSIGVNN